MTDRLPTPTDLRRALEAERLRDNLRRRKAQQRGRSAADAPLVESAPLPLQDVVSIKSREYRAMAVMSDIWIRDMATKHGMIEPFVEGQKREGVISYGLSSYGYDSRVADEFKIFTHVDAALVDPKHFDPKSFVERQTDVCIVPPNSFALARTVEYFRIPRDILTICLGKSTYARCGIIVNVTPLEPEWEGHVTIEISNTTPLPAKIYANEGICQFLFLKGDQPCEVSYADRAGKYMKQTGVTLPRI